MSESVSFLFDSHYYFLDTVFIIPGSSGFRLVVIHDWKILADNHYPTLEEAKKDFCRLFRQRGYRPGLQPLWEDNYMVEGEWLQKKKRLMARSPVINYAYRCVDTLYKKIHCFKHFG